MLAILNRQILMFSKTTFQKWKNKLFEVPSLFFMEKNFLVIVCVS